MYLIVIKLHSYFIYFSACGLWVISHNKKPFKNITCPNSIVFPLKEKNMTQHSLWWILCFHFSLILYKIVGGEARLLKGLISCGNSVKPIEMAGKKDKPKENISADRNYVCVWERPLYQFSAVSSRSVGFVSISPPTWNPVLVSCLELKNQWGFEAESCNQDLFLLTSLIPKSGMLIGFFPPMILHYDRACGEKLHSGCFLLRVTLPPSGPRWLFLGNKHTYLLS